MSAGLFGSVFGLVSSGLAADAQKTYARALKDVSTEPLPPAWQSSLNSILANSQRSAASYQQAVRQQQQLSHAVLIGGAAIVLYLLVR